jgi:MoxR-like ATPase
MDRFAVRLGLGYVTAEAEVQIIAAQEQRHPLESIDACISVEEMRWLKLCARRVRIGAELRRYAVEIARATRVAPTVQLGAGPRASLALSRLAQALALVQGDDYVKPEHIRDLAVPVLAHRLVLDPQARFSGVTTPGVVEEILKSMPVPA